MTIKCIAVDDEPLALTQLAGYIRQVPFLELIASCQDAFEATSVLSKKEIDLLFVDINMPDLNGLDFVRSLITKPMVVFTTAYSEYAVEGFKVEAIDYLLKPFDFNDLLKAAVKAFRVYNFQNDSSLFIKADSQIIRINLPDVLYVEKTGNSVNIHLTTEESPLTVSLKLETMEERLPVQYFMRIHQAYIVNLRRIVAISRMRIVMSSDIYIPIGDEYNDRFMGYINRLSIKR